jgi:hypothetical protein
MNISRYTLIINSLGVLIWAIVTVWWTVGMTA